MSDRVTGAGEERLAHLQRLATIGEQAAGLTHELRQPLAAIRHFAEAGLRSLRSDSAKKWDDVADALANVFVQAGRAQQLAEHAGAFSRRSSANRVQCTVPQLIEAAVSLVEFEAEQRQAKICLEIDENVPPFFADPVQIEQVLVNLVRNAIEAVAEQPPDRRRVVVRGAREADSLRLEVADSGAGIPPENMTQVFSHFFSTKLDGVGLGLAVSREIVEHHGGKIWVTNNSDGGVTFHVSVLTGESDLDAENLSADRRDDSS